jgi:lipoprotein-anchoring transpeptidase ErfK/SrfK
LPLSVRFDQPIKDHRAAQDALSVTTTPKQEGAWYWIDDREVHYRPAVYWRPGTQITLNINVFGVDLGGGIYGQTNRSIHYTVHDSWIAKADGATETMLIYQNEKLVMTMPISMGKDATPTHVGAHVVSFKAEKYVMDSCTYGVCSGPHAYVATEHWAVRISNDGEFVHENPKSIDYQGNTNVSNGCINLNEKNAKWFYAHFNIGDVVEVNNSGGGPLPIYDRYGDWAVPWEVWRAGNA